MAVIFGGGRIVFQNKWRNSTRLRHEVNNGDVKDTVGSKNESCNLPTAKYLRTDKGGGLTHHWSMTEERLKYTSNEESYDGNKWV